MKTLTSLLPLLITLNCPVDLKAASTAASDPELAAKRLITEIDQQVAAEQYRHLQMEVFRAGLEMELIEVNLRHAPGEDLLRRGERELAVQRERAELLRARLAELRERLSGLHVRGAELEKESAAAASGALDGVWAGQDAKEEARIRLQVKGDRARLEIVSGEEWYEMGWKSEPRDGGFWELTLLLKDGSESRHLGEVCLGLARLEGEELLLAVNKPGNPVRPTSFDSGGESTVLTLRRQ